MEKELPEYQDRRLALHSEKIDRLNESVERLCRNVVEVQTDVSWLKSFFWIIATASVGGLIVQLTKMPEVVQAFFR